jgi:uncharacterized iron-regulated membrane protein
MTGLLFFGIAALLINILFYYKEIQGIVLALALWFKRKASLRKVWDAVILFIADIAVTGFVVLCAGSGLYAFVIGSVGGAIVSIVLNRQMIMNYFFKPEPVLGAS